MSPGTAGTWVNTLGSESMVPLINLMNAELLAEGLIQMDETYLQVLNSEKFPSSDHYMVVRIAGPPHRRIVLFDYIPARTAEALKAENVQAADSVEALEALLPWNVKLARRPCSFTSGDKGPD